MPKRKKKRKQALTADESARVQRLRDARLAKRLTQEDVAAVVGVTGTTVHRYEAEGTIPPADVALKMAKLYERSANYLILGEEEPEDEPPPMQPKLSEFLAGTFPQTSMLDDWMIPEMRKARFPENLQPTLETYKLFVMGLASTEKASPKGPSGSDGSPQH